MLAVRNSFVCKRTEFLREKIYHAKKMDGNFRWESNLRRIKAKKLICNFFSGNSSDIEWFLDWANQFYFCEILLRIYSLRHIIVQSNDEKISIMLISQRSSVLEFFLVWYINKRIAVCLKATKFQQKMNLLCAVLNNVLKRGSWHAICVNFFFIVWPKSSVHSVLNLFVLWKRFFGKNSTNTKIVPKKIS